MLNAAFALGVAHAIMRVFDRPFVALGWLMARCLDLGERGEKGKGKRVDKSWFGVVLFLLRWARLWTRTRILPDVTRHCLQSRYGVEKWYVSL